MDIYTAAKIIAGISGTGSWAILDEFNRISVEVQSIFASMIYIFRSALKRKVDRYILPHFAKDCNIRPSGRLFITSNPGYAGRNTIPIEITK